MATAYDTNERQRDAERKRAKRSDEKLVIVPPCQDPIRRARLEADDIAWLMFYFGVDSEVRDPFWYEFTAQQRRMISSFAAAIRFGGDQSVAASRGEGKTTNLERLILKYTLQGILKYSVLFQATGALADNSLDSIKTSIEENVLLHADYPEVCVPVLALENTPNRAHYQIVSGFRHDSGEPYEMAQSKFTWCGQEIIFPNVPGSPAAKSIIATRGLDSAVRGLKKRGLRPQLAAIDDPDTEETSRSEEQAKKLEERIDKAIGGLGSQQKPIARILLCTIPSRISAAWKFTDAKQKPSWKGIRFRYLITPPIRSDLWEEYVQIRSSEFSDLSEGKTTDEHCRRSHQFFIDNYDEMIRGAVVANPNRYNGELLPDGSQVELCSLQRYYNEVARLGPEAVATEYDNDPPEESGPIGSGITPTLIQRRLSGFAGRIVPPDCVYLTRGVDVRKSELHYVVKAWRKDATNFVVDRDTVKTHGTVFKSDEGLERAIYDAILRLYEEYEEHPCIREDGEIVPVDVTLIDSGWQAPAVYDACRTIGIGVFASKGHGKSSGCATLSFSEASNRTPDRKPGDGWFQKRHREPLKADLWIVHCDTDRWKAFEHSRWLTAADKPGAAFVFGEMTGEELAAIENKTPREGKLHGEYAEHICAETEVEEVIKGKLVRYWKPSPKKQDNHYLDASYLADVGAWMKGIRLVNETKKAAIPTEKRPTMAQLAKGVRG